VVGFVIRRLVSAVLVLWATSLIVFGIFFYGPSDPGQTLCGQGTRCTPEKAELINESLGFNDPVVQQYGEWLGGVFVGRTVTLGSSEIDCPAPCLGVSYRTREPVWDIIKDRYPATLSIAIGGAAIFLTVGTTLGVIAARNRGTALDRTMVGGSLIVSSIPYYLLALLAFLYLVQVWGIFPSTSYTPLTESPWGWFTALLLPWMTIGLANSTQYARYSRGSMVEILNEDFVRTARAKGLRERRIVLKHALRAAIVPVVTIFGLDFAALLAGTIFTEQIFGIDGIGRTAIQAIPLQNLPVISATVLIAAGFVVMANLIVDILYSVIDPRVRLT
jgi:peptide/nickel transport system permease protein